MKKQETLKENILSLLRPQQAITTIHGASFSEVLRLNTYIKLYNKASQLNI